MEYHGSNAIAVTVGRDVHGDLFVSSDDVDDVIESQMQWSCSSCFVRMVRCLLFRGSVEDGIADDARNVWMDVI